jgi:hypothetical protein
MTLGISRTSAIALSDCSAADSYTRDQCLEWLARDDLDALDLRAPVRREVVQGG